jgi:hypothetical protein
MPWCVNTDRPGRSAWLLSLAILGVSKIDAGEVAPGYRGIGAITPDARPDEGLERGEMFAAVRGLCVVVGGVFLLTPVACAGGGEGGSAARTASGAATGTVYLTWERAAVESVEPGAECRADFAWTAEPLDLTGREGKSEAFNETSQIRSPSLKPEMYASSAR